MTILTFCRPAPRLSSCVTTHHRPCAPGDTWPASNVSYFGHEYVCASRYVRCRSGARRRRRSAYNPRCMGYGNSHSVGVGRRSTVVLGAPPHGVRFSCRRFGTSTCWRAHSATQKGHKSVYKITLRGHAEPIKIKITGQSKLINRHTYIGDFGGD